MAGQVVAPPDPRAARRAGFGAAAAVFALALGARLSMVFVAGGSLRSSTSYDTGVYYASADAFVHGRLPYRDFTLVHPPGVMLALTPFAALGRLTTDHTGFVLATVAWAVLGAVDSVLVLRVARALGLGPRAAVIGALTYGLWYEAIRTEYSVRLEPLGNLLLLLGVLALARARGTGRAWPAVLGGAALGAAVSVKIWYAVPLVVLLGWLAVRPAGRPRVGRVTRAAVAGTAGALVLLDGPFFLAAPRAMWQMVVSDQFGRPRSGSTARRLASLVSGGQTTAHTAGTVIGAVLLVGAVLAAGLAVLAWRQAAGRLPCVLLAAQLAVLLAAPTFYLYYSDYLAPALALTVAAAAASLLGAGAGRRVLGVPAALVAVLPPLVAAAMVVVVDVHNPLVEIGPPPAHAVRARVAGLRCVQSDSPMALIQLDALGPDLAHGCPVWVDVVGRTYRAPLRPTGTVAGRPATRLTWAPWQRAIRDYLLAGQASVVVDPRGAGIAEGTLGVVRGGPVLARSPGYVLHATTR